MVRADNATILVVEDDAGVAILQKRRLERAGYAVAVAASTDEAMARLSEHGVDLILLDYRLPGDVDGLEFYDRARLAGYTVPVILVTGFSSEATVIKALRAGVRDYVAKTPEYLDYLPVAIDQVLNQVRIERKLAESEARLAAIIGTAKDAIIIAAEDGQVMLFNAAAERMFLCRTVAAVGTPVSRFVPQDILEPAPVGFVPWTQHIVGGRGRRADGEQFPLEVSISRGDLHGQKFFTYVIRDVTERVRTEEAVHLRDRALESFPQGVSITDHTRPDEPIVYVNPAFLSITGYSHDEIVGRNCRCLQGKDTDPVAVARLREAIREERSCVVELLNYRKDGTPFWNALSIAPVRNPAGRVTHFVGVQTVVTEFKQLEEQYRQAQKMEAVGRLAGGIAHDFNNLLTVILGYSEVLLNAKQLEDHERELIREIRKAGERAAGLTQQLLAFSRKQILAPQVLDLNTLVSESEVFLRRIIGEDVNLVASLSPNLGRVKVDPGQMQQVILNLVINSRDAMPQGGLLTIETRNADLDDSYAENHSEVIAGEYVMLAVTDTGHGMDEATKARIFEPFFTTKKVGEGTGLGLATVFGIVKQSGGRIEVYSEPNRGTSFKIYFPRVRDTLTAGHFAELPPVPHGTETILLAEDEPGVRSLIALTLRSSGYNVLEAGDGEEALRILSEHHGEVRLLLTDLVMPKMSGRQLADHVTRAKPDVKIAFLSGYTDDFVVRQGMIFDRATFLQKPFTPATLTRKVREVLDKA